MANYTDKNEPIPSVRIETIQSNTNHIGFNPCSYGTNCQLIFKGQKI